MTRFLSRAGTFKINCAERQQINSDTAHLAPPWSNKLVELATIGLWIKNLLSERKSTPRTSTLQIQMCCFFETRSHACTWQLFNRGTLCERTHCERHCATIPFVQTCSRRYLWRASRSVSTLRKKARIPSANIKKHSNHKRKTRKVFFFYFGRTTQHHVRGSVLILSDGKAHKICGSRQHPHDTGDAQPHGVKTEHKSVDAACKTTSTARHKKPSAPSLDQHLPMLARNHAHPRNGNIPESVDAMGQHCLENHDALFWINPFVMSRSPRHQRHNVSEISDTREDTTTTTTKTHFEGTTCNIGHDAVSWYLLPVRVPSQKQLKPERISIKRNNTNGKEQSEHAKQKHQPNRNHRSNQQILTTTPPAIDLHTPQKQTPLTS